MEYEVTKTIPSIKNFQSSISLGGQKAKKFTGKSDFWFTKIN